jgi:hypothetical protein
MSCSKMTSSNSSISSISSNSSISSISSNSSASITCGIKTKMFFDCSGSVGKCLKYFRALREIFEKNGSLNHLNNEYYMWDTNCNKKTPSEINFWLMNMSGYGGTCPHVIAPYLSADSEIIIVTDGQIGHADIQRCSRKITERNIRMKKCILIMIQTGYSIDLSVPAAFSPHAEEFEFWLMERTAETYSIKKYVAAENITFEKYFENPELFISDVESLRDQISGATLGTTSNEIHHRLCELQKKLQQHFARLAAEKLNDSESEKPEHIRFIEMSISEKYQHFTKVYNLNNESELSLPEKVNAEIQRLIAANKDTSFGTNIIFGSMYRAPTVAASSVAIPEPDPESKIDYECPVLLEADSAGLQICDDRAVLAGLEKNHVEAIIRNPLIILNNPELVSLIRNRISQALGLTTIAEMSRSESSNSNATFRPYRDPLNRNTIIATLPLSTDPAYSKNISYAISKIFFESNKIAGNQTLWLAVIWFVVRDIEYLRETPGLMEQFNELLRHKLCHTKSRLTLSGNPIAPIIDRPMIESIWYSLHSFKIHDIPTGPDDRIRELYPIGSYLIELMNLIGIEIEMEFVSKRIKYSSVLATMRNQELNRTNWKDIIRAQYQPSHLIDETIVFVDANGKVVINHDETVSSNAASSTDSDEIIHHYTPCVSLPSSYFGLSLEEIIGLSRLVNVNRTIGDIGIPLDPSAPIPSAIRNWTAYPIGPDRISDDFEIDPETMRPPKMIRAIEWKDLFYRKFTMTGSDNNWISLYNLFHRFVREISRYPTPAEFIVWLKGVQLRAERSMNTLPTFIVDWVYDLFRRYESIGAFGVPVETFIARGAAGYHGRT